MLIAHQVSFAQLSDLATLLIDSLRTTLHHNRDAASETPALYLSEQEVNHVIVARPLSLYVLSPHAAVSREPCAALTMSDLDK